MIQFIKILLIFATNLQIKNMKTIIFLIFIALFGTATAQTRLFEPKELKEDADYYFSTLFWVHPNPYYFCSANKFNQLKNKIYRELNQPLSKTDFILTMAQINSCLDTHSIIPLDGAFTVTKSLTDKMKKAAFYLLKDSIDNIAFFQDFTIDSLSEFLRGKNIDPESIINSKVFFPIVETRENGLFFLGDSSHTIKTINGISTETMLSEANKYFNRKLNPESNLRLINQYINLVILGKYNINLPFRIKFDKASGEEIREGITLLEWKDEFSSLALASILEYCETPYTYEIYPGNSIAIFHIQTFDGKLMEDFIEQLEEFKKKVNKQGIKYIFYDLTLNSGGQHFGAEAMDIIKHDTVYLKLTETKRIPGAGVVKGKINQIVSFSNLNDNNIPYDRILFVLQSAATASNADYFCRIIAENKLGILVGEPTGELTKTFSSAKECTMPHTAINFQVASIFMDFSEYFKSLTTPPDINLDLKNIKGFTEQELLNIINDYKIKKACIN